MLLQLISLYFLISISASVSLITQRYCDNPTADFSVLGVAVLERASVSPFLSIGCGLVVPALWTAEKQTSVSTPAHRCSSTGCAKGEKKKEKKTFKNEFFMEVQCTSQSKGNRFHVILKSFGESWVPFGVKRRSPFPACCSQEGQLLSAAHCACSQSQPSPRR